MATPRKEAGVPTKSQAIIQVRGHGQGSEADIDRAPETGLHAALEAGYLGSCGRRALPAILPVQAVVGHIPLRRHCLLDHSLSLYSRLRHCTSFWCTSTHMSRVHSISPPHTHLGIYRLSASEVVVYPKPAAKPFSDFYHV